MHYTVISCEDLTNVIFNIELPILKVAAQSHNFFVSEGTDTQQLTHHSLCIKMINVRGYLPTP